METAILELKLVHYLDSVDQETLFLVFLDLQKAYYTVYHGGLLITLDVHGAGPHMCSLLEKNWYQQGVVTRQNRYHKPQFNESRGTTQGGLILPTLFNLIVDNEVWNWLALAV